MTGVYRVTVRAARAEAARKYGRAVKTYSGLRDNSSVYARELRAMITLYAQVMAIWRDAPSDLPEKEQK